MATESADKAGVGKPPGGAGVDHAAIAARAFTEWLSRPRVRLAVTGVILLVIGGLQLTSSVWTLPLVLVGALMVVTAWIGHRLEGRFAVEWGKTGTQLDFRASIRSPQEAHPALPPGTEVAPESPLPREPAREVASQDPDVIEGEAHTVEIDVAELKALIAAVESRTAGVDPPDSTADAIRVLRLAADGPASRETRR